MTREHETTPAVPAWMEDIRRETVDQVRKEARLAGGSDWLDQPWSDLAENRPGDGLLEVARRRRQAGETDLSWRIGADGEDVVAAELRPLTHPRRRSRLFGASTPPPMWRVLHGVKIGAAGIADLDHVVIGPPGVVVINTKQLDPRSRVRIIHGEISVGSRTTDFLAKAARDARRTSWLLASALEAVVARSSRGDLPSSWHVDLHEGVVNGHRERSRSDTDWLSVVPAVIFVGSGPIEGHPWPIVTRSNRLRESLLHRSRTLSDRQVEALYELARRSTLWTRDAPSS